MRKKTQEAYEKVLIEFARIAAIQLEKVSKVIIRTDNEPGSFQAWNRVFGADGLGKEVCHHLCLFHWKQALIRRFKKLDTDFFQKQKNIKFYIWAAQMPLMPIETLEFLKTILLDIVPEFLQG